MANSWADVSVFKMTLGLLSLSVSVTSTTKCRPKTSLDLRAAVCVQYNANCAVAFRAPAMSWTKARDFCRRGGGDLIKLTTEADIDVVTSILRTKASNYNNQCSWIGLNDHQLRGDFRWLDETKTTLESMFHTPYFMRDDNDRCVQHCCCEYGKPSWLKVPCDVKVTLICEFEKDVYSEIPTAMATPSSTRLTDSASMTTTQMSTASVKGPNPTPIPKRTGPYRRSRIFRKVENMVENPYILAKPARIKSTLSTTMCIVKCMEMELCTTVNFSKKLGKCRMFTSTRTDDQQEMKNEPDWTLFMTTDKISSSKGVERT